jgi:hypothetical protein
MPTLRELLKTKKVLGGNDILDTPEVEAASQIKTFRDNFVASDGSIISNPIKLYETATFTSTANKTLRFYNDPNRRPPALISTNNFLLNNSSVPELNKLRKNNKIVLKDKETVLEESLTGLRAFATLSQPVLYGTRTLELIAQRSKSTKRQKLGTYFYESAAADKSIDIINPYANKPTKLWLLNDFRRGKIQDKPKLFSKLNGTFEQIATKLVTNPAGTVKKLVKDIVFSQPKAKTNILPTANLYDNDGTNYTKKVLPEPPGGVEEERNDLSSYLISVLALNELTSKGFYQTNVPIEKRKRKKYTATDNESDVNKFSLETYRGIKEAVNKLTNLRGGDIINASNAYLDSTGGSTSAFDDKDFITLKFHSVEKKASVSFRATISGLTETFSPSWDTNKFIGNPFNFYTYNSIERSVTFTFKVYSNNGNEHISMWERLSFLSSLVYSQGYGSSGIKYTIPPFIRFTLGNMYKAKDAFIESMTYTVPDEGNWEIGLYQTNVSKKIQEDDALKSYKLPKIVEVAITLKLIESVGSTYEFTNDAGTLVATNGKRIYAYGKDVATKGITSAQESKPVPTKSETNNNLNPDGSPKSEQKNGVDKTLNEPKQNNTNSAGALTGASVPNKTPSGDKLEEETAGKTMEINKPD